MILQNKWINRFIPFSGFKACNLFGVIFLRKGAKLDEIAMNHEKIHSRQIAEVMLASLPVAILVAIFTNIWLAGLFVLVSYYLWYGIEWLVHFIRLKDPHLAYRRISFEREAYHNQTDPEYLESRFWFKFIQFL